MKQAEFISSVIICSEKSLLSDEAFSFSLLHWLLTTFTPLFAHIFQSQSLPDEKQPLEAKSRAKDEIKLSKQQRFKCLKNVESGKMGIEHLRNHFDRKFSPAQQTREFYIVKHLCILDFFEHFPMMHNRHQHQPSSTLRRSQECQ